MGPFDLGDGVRVRGDEIEGREIFRGPMEFRAKRIRLRTGGRRAGETRGQALVEFALLVPLLFLLLVGIIEFGVILNNVISVRQGAREAARQGAVAQFGNETSCNLNGPAAGASDNTRKLVCLAKSQIGVDNVRIKLLIDTPDLTASGQPFAVNNGLVVCASYPLSSISGLLSPFLNGRYFTNKTTFRIEQPSPDPPLETEETDPSGGSWSWCAN